MRTVKVMRFGCLFLPLLFPGAPPAQAQLYDVGWTFGDDGLLAYRLEVLDPSSANLGTIGSENQTLPLEVGNRPPNELLYVLERRTERSE